MMTELVQTAKTPEDENRVRQKAEKVNALVNREVLGMLITRLVCSGKKG